MQNSAMISFFSGYILYPAVFLLVGIGVLVVFNRFLDSVSACDDLTEVIDKKNAAIAIQRGGAFIGLATAIVGSMLRTRNGFVSDLQWFVGESVLALVLFIACTYLNDLFILRRSKNCEELEKGNVSVGIVEAASYIATGLILCAAFSGNTGGIASGIVFAVLGQCALLVLHAVMELRTSYSITRELSLDNRACAMIMAGELIALGLVLRVSIAGETQGWVADLRNFGLSLIGALILLWVARGLADLIFLPKTTITRQVMERNVAAATIVCAISIATAIIVTVVA